MMGPTHRLGGITVSLIGYIWLFNSGNLIPEIHPLLQLLIIYPFAYYGSTFPDLDHHAGSIPSRDVVSLAVNKILHLGTPTRKRMEKSKMDKGPLYKFLGIFDARHRAWQTHSDLTIVAFIALIYWLSNINTGSSRDLILLVGTGFILGLIAHYIYDAITPSGVFFTPFTLLRLIPALKKIFPRKLRLVPNKPFFATGAGWETLVSRVSFWATIGLTIWAIYISVPFEFGTLDLLP